MRFSKHTIILRKENRVVLVNKCTRNWYRLSEELFSVIKFAVDKNLADDELLQNLYDEEDTYCVGKSEFLLGNINKEGFKEDKILEFQTINAKCNPLCEGCGHLEHCVSSRCKFLKEITDLW